MTTNVAQPFTEIPGPKAHFFAGNLPELHLDVLGFFERCAKDFGDVVRTRFWSVPGVQLTHPQDVHDIFVRHNDALEKPIDFKLLKLMIGTGLLTSEGDEWRRQRRMIQPTFAPDQVQGYGAFAIEATNAEVDRWQDGERIDVYAAMSRVSLQVASRAFVGVDLERDAEIVGRALDQFMNEFERIWTSAVLPIPTWGTVRAYLSRRRLDRLIYRLIDAERDTTERDDLLTRLRALQDEQGRLARREVRDQVVTLLMAGHETTALAVSYTLMLLAEHPAEADALAEALGDRPPTVQDLARLTPVRHAVQEAMRLYPPAWAVGRATKRPLRLAGYVVPRGTQVYVLPWVTQRDPRFFEAPSAFRPDRWRDDAKSLNRKAYFPFGGGPRKCIGAHLAIMEATLMVATIVRQYRMRIAADHRLDLQPAVTLRPRHGIRVELERR